MVRTAKVAGAVVLVVIALAALAYGAIVLLAVIRNTSDTATYVLLPFALCFLIAAAASSWAAWRLLRASRM
jgi:hypothetical protein